MHPNISSFVSKTFYESKVKDGKGTIKKSMKLSAPYNKEVIFIDTSSDTQAYEKKRGLSYINELESKNSILEDTLR